jgi:Xaa-Pro aminopeptidase
MRATFPEKYAQIAETLREKRIDLWLLMGRETLDIADPALRLVLPVDVMGVSAFFFTADGKRLALVRRQDVEGVAAVGVFDEVTGYGDDFDELLRATIESLAPNVIDINVDLYDALTDGLTTGLYLRLMRALAGTPYEGRISHGQAIRSIRGRKVAPEIREQTECLRLLNQACDDLKAVLRVGMTEGEVYDFCQAFMKAHGLVSSWDTHCCPLVHAGARSAQGLVQPGDNAIRPGDTFHLSFGAKRNGYATDFQRTWYIRESGETGAPEEVQRAFDTIVDIIEHVRLHARPGMEGREVDALARERMERAGYAYARGSGHMVGMALHDGCVQLCPDTPMLGDLPRRKLERDAVFTLELFIPTDRGVVAIEDMVRLTDRGGEFLYLPQKELWLL